MDTQTIISFLCQIAANNTRPWFAEHRAEYDEARATFEAGASKALARIATIDPTVAHLSLKDITYRFYRDTRFSPDKSPYKRHFGAYIAAHGKKALHGGYYLHMEPGHCLLACNSYYLPTNILTSCRNEIMANIDEWRRCVESPEFLRHFGRPACGDWDSARGFGMEHLKTCPAGFPRDYPYIAYLRMKDYCCWQHVPDDFFEGDAWLDPMEEIFRAAKPAMDFINAVIDDYE